MRAILTRSELRHTLCAALAASLLLLNACGGGGDAGAPLTPPVSGPAWWGFGRDAQHSALGGNVAAQDFNRISWSTPIDVAPQYRPGGALLTHYGSPVITPFNTVIVPVKTGATDGFRLDARSGRNGALVWSAITDYVLPAHNWIPSYNPTLSADNRLYAPAGGGKLMVRDNPDSASGTFQTAVFYGASVYAASPASYDTQVFINTPITADAAGNVYFGFIATGATPAGLVSGVARIGANGTGSWVGAAAASGDAGIVKVATNSGPAVSTDGRTLYVTVNTAVVAGTVQRGYLLALDSTTLAFKSKVALIDPGANLPARITDDSTASPTIGPNGDVYIGVLENTYGSHNARGWLLHFDATLATTKIPGAFGWDNTASVVPATMVPSYTGSSSYLLAVKYNNYDGVGTGDGSNRMAILDPNTSQTDPISGRAVMKEVLSILGQTYESGSSGPVKEWCINTAAVDPITFSVIVNSEDGYLYRWDLRTNTFTQRIQLTSGLGESYTPTAIGADGAVYAVNNGVLFSIAR